MSEGARSRLLPMLALLGLFAPESGFAQERAALVIGNSEYRTISPLSNPVNDATAVGELFKRAGFDSVSVQRNLGRAELRRVVGDFAAVARKADIAVIYFAGHGIEVDGTNFLIPVDAALQRDFDVEDEALSLDRMLKVLEPARRLRLVILDACRDNPFVSRMKRTSATRSVGRGLSRIEPTTPDTVVAYAAKAGTVAEDGSGRHSPFTAALLQHLGSPGLDLRLALGRVRDDVMTSTGNKQEPFVYGSLGGNVVALSPAPASANMPVETPVAVKPAADVQEEYALAVRLGTLEAYDTFLARNPAGFLADLARTQRARLADPVAPQPPGPSGDRQTAAIPAPDAQPPAPAASPAPAAFDAYRKHTFEVTFKQIIREIAPRRGTWSATRRHTIDVRSENELVTTRMARSDFNGATRSNTGTAPLGQEGDPMGWRMDGERLVARETQRGGGSILTMSIARNGNSCTAAVAFEKAPGRQHITLPRLSNGEIMTLGWIKAEKVACRVTSEATATRAAPRR